MYIYIYNIYIYIYIYNISHKLQNVSLLENKKNPK